MRHLGFKGLLALAMLLALPFAALSEAAPEAPETGAVEVDAGEEAGAESMPGEVGGMSLLDLSGEGSEGVESEPTPEVTNTPEPTPAPTKVPIPWLTSRHYPKDKINFEDEIWDILTGKWGLTDFQAAGLMSSIQAESSFCPYNAQDMGGSDDRGEYLFSTGDSVGFGLCQWTSAGRKEGLRRYARSQGSSDLVWDFDVQMGYMAREIDVDSLKEAGSLYDVAEWTVLKYERPNLRYRNSWPGTRYEKGLEIYRNHTGRDYDEPPLRFSATWNGMDAANPEGVRLSLDGAATLTVNSNYYWRLEQVEPTAAGWLDVRCAQVYNPQATELCVCGYASEGDKALTLTAAKRPGPGETYAATLRFEIYRGGHAVVEVPVSMKSPIPGLHPLALGAALFGAAMAMQ